MGNSSTGFADFRVGLSAALNDATGGPETFFLTRRAPTLPATSLESATVFISDAAAAPSILPLPEPATFTLMLAGLGAIGVLARRRPGSVGAAQRARHVAATR